MTQIDPIAALIKYKIPYLKIDGDDWIKVKSPYATEVEDLREARGGIHVRSGIFKCLKQDINIPLVAY